jgi:hypothetical protein
MGVHNPRRMKIERAVRLMAAISLAAFANAILLDFLIADILTNCTKSAFLPRALLFTFALWLLPGALVAFYWAETKIHRWLIGIPAFGALAAVVIAPLISPLHAPIIGWILIQYIFEFVVAIFAGVTGFPVFLGVLELTSAALRTWPRYRLVTLAGTVVLTVAPFAAFLWRNSELTCILIL